MPEEILIVDAVLEANHVDIWDHCARHTEEQPPLWQLARWETAAEGKGYVGMGNRGRHQDEV